MNAHSTIIRKCSHLCKHEYQDARYGKGNRVMNSTNSTAKPIPYRCTVCAGKN